MDGKNIIYVLPFLTILTFIISFQYSGVQWRGNVWKDSWLEIQQDRRQQILDTCSKYPELERQKIDYTPFYFSPDYSLLYCALGKVGSTSTFMTTFKQILDGEDWKEYPKGKRNRPQLFQKKLKSDNFFLLLHIIINLTKSFLKLWNLGYHNELLMSVTLANLAQNKS